MAATCNHYYGHSAILARYAGLERPHPIFGYMLHGWYAWYPWMPDAEAVIESVPRGFPVIAWSERDVEKLRQAGVTKTFAIGSPFLYLLEMRGEPAPGDERALVSFPFHTLPNAGFEDAWGPYASYLESLTQYERITVCLYYLEYENDEVRGEFERRGFETATNGSYDEPEYLNRFYDLASRHGAVTSNRVSTALIYGAAMGRRAFLGGPVPAVTEQQIKGPMSDEGRRTERFQREQFPALVDGLEPKPARAFGRRQLGAASMRSPEELKQVLGWTGARKLGARAAAATASLRRRALARSR